MSNPLERNFVPRNKPQINCGRDITPLVYLALPYSQDPAVSFEEANRFAFRLLYHGIMTYSPISHSHPISAYRDAATGNSLGTDYKSWQRLAETMIDRCQLVIVLCNDGWATSEGVKAECKYAEKIGVPVYLAKELSILELQNIRVMIGLRNEG
jgi:hypothetical protein